LRAKKNSQNKKKKTFLDPESPFKTKKLGFLLGESRKRRNGWYTIERSLMLAVAIYLTVEIQDCFLDF
jgi:uncharacterized ferredoxin-like protein